MFFESLFKQDGTNNIVEMNLQAPRQLFNTLDPSPFHEKELNSAVERYIVDSVEERSFKEAVHLVIHLPENVIASDMERQFQDDIQRHFIYRASEARCQLRRCFREGRTALLVGFLFLLSCLMMRELLLSYGDGFFYGLLAEGLLITGWVALWHPLDVFLYHWRPLLKRYRLLKKISQLSVKVAPSSASSFYPESHKA